MFCYLSVDSKNFTLGLINDLNVGGNLFCACANGNVLALFNDVHKLVVIVALDRGFERPYVAVQTAAFDIGYNLVNNADKLVFTRNFGKDLEPLPDRIPILSCAYKQDLCRSLCDLWAY